MVGSSVADEVDLTRARRVLDDMAPIGHGHVIPLLQAIQASNPVLSTLRQFRDEYLAHVIDKTCPAGACKALAPQELVPAGMEA